MGILKKIKYLIIINVFLFSNCHFFAEDRQNNNVNVYFNETNVSVFSGGLGSLSLVIDPADQMRYHEVHYRILNEEIATVFRADRRGVTFYGRGEGSTVIIAKVADAEARAVINVLD